MTERPNLVRQGVERLTLHGARWRLRGGRPAAHIVVVDARADGVRPAQLCLRALGQQAALLCRISTTKRGGSNVERDREMR
eukprot:2637222-Pyramimonas_sp.AAC.1